MGCTTIVNASVGRARSCTLITCATVAALLTTAACDRTTSLRSRRPVLLHTDARLRANYTVAKSWSPRVADHSEVARASFTLFWLGDTTWLPMDGNLEGMSMDVAADGVVTLALSFDLTFPSAPSRYRCTATGSVWLRE